MRVSDIGVEAENKFQASIFKEQVDDRVLNIIGFNPLGVKVLCDYHYQGGNIADRYFGKIIGEFRDYYLMHVFGNGYTFNVAINKKDILIGAARLKRANS